MATNIQEFRLKMGDFVAASEEMRRAQTKIVALRGLRGLVFGTRVDTGRARANWQVAGGAPPEGYDEDQFDKIGSGTLARGNREILAESGERIIWMHNGVPYIGRLEDKDKMLAGTYSALKTWLESR